MKAKPAFVLSGKHVDTIMRVAKILNVRPADFFRWKMGYALDSLNDPDGELWEWVMNGLIEWDTPADEEAARQRYADWLREKGVSEKVIERRMRPPLTEAQIDRIVDHLVPA